MKLPLQPLYGWDRVALRYNLGNLLLPTSERDGFGQIDNISVTSLLDCSFVIQVSLLCFEVYLKFAALVGIEVPEICYDVLIFRENGQLYTVINFGCTEIGWCRTVPRNFLEYAA